jgi:prevent-host-death family protein
METVTHREMRNNSGEILRRVEAGESVQVTNNGRVAALIVPPSSDPLTDLAQRGQLRPALREPSTIRDIRRRATRRRSEHILADSRGQW